MRVWQILHIWLAFIIRLPWVWVCVANNVWCLNCLLTPRDFFPVLQQKRNAFQSQNWSWSRLSWLQPGSVPFCKILKKQQRSLQNNTPNLSPCTSVESSHCHTMPVFLLDCNWRQLTSDHNFTIWICQRSCCFWFLSVGPFVPKTSTCKRVNSVLMDHVETTNCVTLHPGQAVCCD